MSMMLKVTYLILLVLLGSVIFIELHCSLLIKIKIQPELSGSFFTIDFSNMLALLGAFAFGFCHIFILFFHNSFKWSFQFSVELVFSWCSEFKMKNQVLILSILLKIIMFSFIVWSNNLNLLILAVFVLEKWN